MTDLFENYTSPWMNDELSMLRDAARKFFTTELAPHQESWEANGIVDREAWSKTGTYHNRGLHPAGRRLEAQDGNRLGQVIKDHDRRPTSSRCCLDRR